MSIISIALHQKQSVYNLRQQGAIARKVHDSTTRKYLATKIITDYNFHNNPTPEQTRTANHILLILKDGRRVK